MRFSQTFTTNVSEGKEKEFIIPFFLPDDSLTFADPLEQFAPVTAVLLLCLYRTVSY